MSGLDSLSHTVRRTRKIRCAEFQNQVHLLESTSDRTTLNLVDEAEALIEALSTHPEYVPRWLSSHGGVGVHTVLRSVLQRSLQCGGQRAYRRIAALICTCRGERDFHAVETLEHLQIVGILLYSHFLWPLRADISIKDIDGATESSVAVSNRMHASLLRMVLDRQSYRCIITDAAQEGGYPPSAPGPHLSLEVARFMKQGVTLTDIFPDEDEDEGDDDNNVTDGLALSADATKDLLRGFLGVDGGDFFELLRLLENPANAIVLERNARVGFDRFQWTLVPSDTFETTRDYVVKTYTPYSIFWRGPPERVVFRDNSVPEFDPYRGIALPNPLLVKLHSTVAQIMHESGAGVFFDRVTSEYLNRTCRPAPSGDSFLKDMDHFVVQPYGQRLNGSSRMEE